MTNFANLTSHENKPKVGVGLLFVFYVILIFVFFFLGGRGMGLGLFSWEVKLAKLVTISDDISDD